ncbi:MAG: M24 family metallopeptidase, partial [Thermoleophilia bacterium]|nr:M24 family metallopeptidase [Thermoleophilia bacterium]
MTEHPEAERKRSAAFEAAGPFATNDPADVRWLLCGRGRPVSAGTSPYTVEVTPDVARVWYQDIERPRIEAEERWEELGYEPRPYAWFEPLPDFVLSQHLQGLRLELGPEEVDRYRRAAADAAGALVELLGELRPEQRELDVAGAIAGALYALGFTTPVVLVGGESRAPVHRHPLPTDALLGRFALLAFTAERDGLYSSMTRVVSFGAPLPELERAVRAAAEVDAAVLAEARPGRTLGELFETIVRTYGSLGLPDEWRRHHQGGLTGYKGREVFAVPGDTTVLPPMCAVAFNPSVTGGGKSEDTVLVTSRGVEVLTRTPTLPELE